MNDTSTIHGVAPSRLTPDVLFTWTCHSCGFVLGVVKARSVIVRFKGTQIEAPFPMLRKCHKCATFNLCAGPKRTLTSIATHESL